MALSFVPGYLGKATLVAEEVSAYGNVMGISLAKAALRKPVFGQKAANVIGGQYTGTFTISGHVAASKVEQLDTLFNTGGNGLTMIPFINEIIKRDQINRLGGLYTIMGRRTFSAAVLLIAELMIHTKVLLVGEPAGAAQNMFSDMMNTGTLSNSSASSGLP